jgi:hypothetical protein
MQPRFEGTRAIPRLPPRDVFNTSDMRKWNGALKDAVFGKLHPLSRACPLGQALR